MPKLSSPDGAIQPQRGSEFKRNPAVAESDLGESLLVFETSTENVHALNITGKIVWNSLSSGNVSSVKKLAEKVLEWFPAEPDKDKVALSENL